MWSLALKLLVAAVATHQNTSPRSRRQLKSNRLLVDSHQVSVTNRQTVLDILSGKKIEPQPAFSGLIHVTAEGLQSEGLAFHEVHQDARRMARAAASTFRLSGLLSAVVPLDMYVEAEALGAQIDFRRKGELLFPQVAKPLLASTKYLNSAYF